LIRSIFQVLNTVLGSPSETVRSVAQFIAFKMATSRSKVKMLSEFQRFLSNIAGKPVNKGSAGEASPPYKNVLDIIEKCKLGLYA